jgi:hypothetical protein
MMTTRRYRHSGIGAGFWIPLRRVAAMRNTLLSISVIAAMSFAGIAAQAQDLPPKIWDIKLGTPIAALPL